MKVSLLNDSFPPVIDGVASSVRNFMKRGSGSVKRYRKRGRKGHLVLSNYPRMEASKPGAAVRPKKNRGWFRPYEARVYRYEV